MPEGSRQAGNSRTAFSHKNKKKEEENLVANCCNGEDSPFLRQLRTSSSRDRNLRKVFDGSYGSFFLFL